MSGWMDITDSCRARPTDKMGLIVKLFLSGVAVAMILAGFEDFGVTFVPGVALLAACWLPGMKLSL